ncbi:MAG: hypothetical protein QXP06_07150 [Candidatus Bathyarchaeia archaeon]
MGMYKKLDELGITYTILALRRLYFLAPWRRTLKVACRLNKSLEVSLKRIDKKIYETTIRAKEVRADSSSVILIHGGGGVNDLRGLDCAF